MPSLKIKFYTLTHGSVYEHVVVVVVRLGWGWCWREGFLLLGGHGLCQWASLDQDAESHLGARLHVRQEQELVF